MCCVICGHAGITANGCTLHYKRDGQMLATTAVQCDVESSAAKAAVQAEIAVV